MSYDSTRYHITTASSFEAARQVKILDPVHPSARLHGHSFKMRSRTPLTPGKESVETLKLGIANLSNQLDYRLLNDFIEIPTDENIARWVQERIGVPFDLIGIQSTEHQGVDMNKNGVAYLWKKFRFEASHQLPNVHEGHKCGRMHGHGFEIVLHVCQEIGDGNLGIDYDELKRIWSPIGKQLEGKCLNEISGLENPTSEVIAYWLWEKLSKTIEELSWLTVYETATAGCHYNGEIFKVWKQFPFEAAIKETSNQSITGHSYLARLHCSGDLDETLGWVIDYGDIKDIFKPFYDRIDHHYINDLKGISEPSLKGLIDWIKKTTANDIPSLDRIDLYETPTYGLTASWGIETPALPI